MLMLIFESTTDLINFFKRAVNLYNLDCHYSTPGKKGIERKVNFLILLSKLTNYTQELAILYVYDFLIQSEKANLLQAKLNTRIEKQLIDLFEIKPKRYHSTNWRSAAFKYANSAVEMRTQLDLEIAKLKTDPKVIHEIQLRKYLRLVAQGKRDNTCLFSVLPDEVNVMIAESAAGGRCDKLDSLDTYSSRPGVM